MEKIDAVSQHHGQDSNTPQQIEGIDSVVWVGHTPYYNNLKDKVIAMIEELFVSLENTIICNCCSPGHIAPEGMYR